MPPLVLGDAATTEEKDPEGEEAITPTDPSEGEGTPEDASDLETIPDEGEGEKPDPTSAAPEVEPTEIEEATKALDAIARQKEVLLADIVGLRAERRNLKSPPTELFVAADKKPLTDDLADVPEADRVLIEKVVKGLGYVKKDEVLQETYKDKLEGHKNSWLESHPEYLPANDPDDKKWNALQRTMAELFERNPSDPRRITKMLDLAHREINPSSILPTRSGATAAAAKTKLAAVAKSGGGAAAPAPAKAHAPVNRSHFKGTDEEFEELFG